MRNADDHCACWANTNVSEKESTTGILYHLFIYLKCKMILFMHGKVYVKTSVSLAVHIVERGLPTFIAYSNMRTYGYLHHFNMYR